MKNRMRDNRVSKVSMPSRAYTSLLRGDWYRISYGTACVNALTGLYLIATAPKFKLARIVNLVSMPSRAYTSLLPKHCSERFYMNLIKCQCPHGLIPHCYRGSIQKIVACGPSVSMPSRAYTSLLHVEAITRAAIASIVSMPSRAYTSLLPGITRMFLNQNLSVNALTGLYLIATILRVTEIIRYSTCQCPHGLIPHCYWLRLGVEG